MENKEITTLLKENRIFNPSRELVENSNIKRWMEQRKIKNVNELKEKCKDLEWFWKEVAEELIEFFEPYDRVLEWNKPWVKWFVNGKYNIVHDALDKHIKTRKNKVAFFWEGENGDKRTLTYNQLYQEVNKTANALKSLGIKKGDRVAIYMPMIPELPISMLACAKIGAIHTVVFSGFSSIALTGRINDCEARLLITCDGFYRRGKIINLKEMADEAVKDSPSIKDVIVFNRLSNLKISWNSKKDIWWHEIVNKQSKECETEKLDANDLLYILYTSGTTGKPKGIMHAHAGYAVGVAHTLRWVFDLKEDDIWWCAADIGWVTGHSYIVYGPLILGATSILYEGAPDYPSPDKWWQIIENYGVNVFYTSPTSIRMFMKYGEEWTKKHNLNSLRLLGSVGEPINPEAWIWYYENIGKSKCQIMDTWWQTETGAFCISPLPITPLKPGHVTEPLPWIEAKILDDEGNLVEDGKGGNLVLCNPWPSMLRGIYKDPNRYKEVYWSRYPDHYLTGDIARKKDGYILMGGRGDDIISIAGHKLSNAEIESALVSHYNVSEAAAIAKPHEIKGQAISTFVVLKNGINANENLRNELLEHVVKQLGKIARPEELFFVNDLPKTRSGKIMRRVIRAKVMNEDVGDISTLANPEAVKEIEKAK